jgi:hypothetical protein
VSDDIEHRLSAAAQAVRELEVVGQRCSDLLARQEQMTAALEELRSQYGLEQREVERLEHLSLARVLVALKGDREEAVSREKAEADAARLRVADAEERLDAVSAALDAAHAHLDELGSASDTYTALLAEQERHIAESADPRRGKVLNLADERGRLTAEVDEIKKAQQAAGAARQALSVVEGSLGSASGWNTYDTFFGGGLMADVMEHSRLDEAARAASEADRRMAVLRTELTDVTETAQLSTNLAISSATKFVDLWFGNIFTDLAIRDRIKQGQQNVARSLQVVSTVEERLNALSAQVQARLAEIESERRDLLTQ